MEPCRLCRLQNSPFSSPLKRLKETASFYNSMRVTPTVGRKPKSRSGEKAVMFSTRLDPTLRALMESEAERDKVSLSDVLDRRLLASYITDPDGNNTRLLAPDFSMSRKSSAKFAVLQIAPERLPMCQADSRRKVKSGASSRDGPIRCGREGAPERSERKLFVC